jgi:dipeptidase D
LETILKGKKKEDYKRILSIFNEINKVPRPSKHEEKMVLYLENFAKSHNLKYIIDGKNVIIYKNATVGMEHAPMVTLQAHQDMVCVAKEGYEIDFLNQGIETINDGTYIKSKDNNTSIGADDGIGVSIILAVLESNTIKHGPLECLFTWNEEQGFSGAIKLTPGILKGKYMMNIDWETDGILCIGSAGTLKMALLLPTTLLLLQRIMSLTNFLFLV